MNVVETGALLTIISGFDRFVVVDRVTTTSWQLVLRDADFELAKAAVIDYYSGPTSGQLRVGDVSEMVKRSQRSNANQIEADVRSAKARGLIDKTWPERDLLPENVRDALFTLRDGERRAAQGRLEFDHLPDRPIDTGDVGREVA